MRIFCPATLAVLLLSRFPAPVADPGMPASCRTHAVFPPPCRSRVYPRLHLVTGLPVPVVLGRWRRGTVGPCAARTCVRRHCSSVRVHRSTRSGVSPSQLTHPPRNPWRTLVDRPRSVERDTCCSYESCWLSRLCTDPMITVMINFAVHHRLPRAAQRHDPARGQPEKYASPGIQSSSWGDQERPS